ncbi:hypothetical protein ACERZ8_19025 [Tateyamaria armeniaca]|uniref:Uncharacterized protein n=1 Tax=Tateyamaria armeniaca TaxID=2518930 RepID=A0ABW8V102_9RHOB
MTAPPATFETTSVLILAALIAFSVFMWSRKTPTYVHAASLGAALLICGFVLGFFNVSGLSNSGDFSVDALAATTPALLQDLAIPAFVLLFAAPWLWVTRRWPPQISPVAGYVLHWVIVLAWGGLVLLQPLGFLDMSALLEGATAQERNGFVQEYAARSRAHGIATLSYFAVLAALWMTPLIGLIVSSLHKRSV